jgi:DNA-binding response OmpR family regulator
VTELLVVEDDETIGALLESGLRANGYQVRWARTGGDALAATRARAAELVLLDLGLPDVDGVDLCRQLRGADAHAVIIMLTARGEPMDVIVGLDAGADDYVTKPFGLVELLARVRAHLRRSAALLPIPDVAPTAGGSTPATPTPGGIQIFGLLRLDLAARRSFVGASDLDLRSKEFDLLARLAAEPGRAVAREDLMRDVWGAVRLSSTKTLDVTMATLRRKIEDGAGRDPTEDAADRIPMISTVRGHGYRLDPPDSAA